MQQKKPFIHSSLCGLIIEEKEERSEALVYGWKRRGRINLFVTCSFNIVLFVL